MSKKSQIKREKSDALSWGIFLATLELALLSSVSIVFPALITRTASYVAEVSVDAWEPGIFTVPFLVTNIATFTFIWLYFTNKLPEVFNRAIKFIFNFEVSKKIAIIVMIILVGIYVGTNFQELQEDESELWRDYQNVLNQLEEWWDEGLSQVYSQHVRFFLLTSSIFLFDNLRVVPFIASIALLIITYLITLEFTKKRFSGLVATVVLLQSFNFLHYDTLATYSNFWILFFFLSLYMTLKFWPLSSVFFIFSILSKPLSGVFLPMIIFLILTLNTTRKKKMIMIIPYLVIIVAAIIAFSVFEITPAGTGLGVYSNLHFWQGFTTLVYQMRFDPLVLFFLIPLIFGLFLAHRKGISNANAVMFFITVILITYPLLTGFSEITNQPYRYIPLTIFFAMGLGIILSKNIPKARRESLQRSK